MKPLKPIKQKDGLPQDIEEAFHFSTKYEALSKADEYFLMYPPIGYNTEIGIKFSGYLWSVYCKRWRSAE